jgi:hypothetical protein
MVANMLFMLWQMCCFYAIKFVLVCWQICCLCSGKCAVFMVANMNAVYVVAKLLFLWWQICCLCCGKFVVFNANAAGFFSVDEDSCGGCCVVIED